LVTPGLRAKTVDYPDGAGGQEPYFCNAAIQRGALRFITNRWGQVNDVTQGGGEYLVKVGGKAFS
jgi:hypothetical protein